MLSLKHYSLRNKIAKKNDFPRATRQMSRLELRLCDFLSYSLTSHAITQTVHCVAERLATHLCIQVKIF